MSKLNYTGVEKVSISNIEYASLYSQINDIRNNLIENLKNSGNEDVKKLATEIPDFLDPKDDNSNVAVSPLKIAFIGQYNSGKSTIISALTGITDIPISSDVCTDKVSFYNWNGLQLIDTPGIHADNPDHDEITEKAIVMSDLLVFVITNELFDDIICNYFKNLCINFNKTSEMMLVVNKMEQDSGESEIKLHNIDQVISPISIEQLSVTFIDALTYLESHEDELSKSDQMELLKISNFGKFVKNLNKFSRERNIFSRLTTPLFKLQDVVLKAISILKIEFPEESAALEILRQQKELFQSSRNRLVGKFEVVKNESEMEILKICDEVTELLELKCDSKILNTKLTNADTQLNIVCDDLSLKIQSIFSTEVVELERQYKALSDSELVKQLLKKLEFNNFKKLESLDIDSSDWANRIKIISAIAKEIGSISSQLTTGSSETHKGLGAVKDSDVHKAIKYGAKKLGKKFRPWESLIIADDFKSLGKVFVGIEIAADVLSPIFEKIQEINESNQILKARQEIMNIFQRKVTEIKQKLTKQCKEIEKEFYEVQQEIIDTKIDELMGKKEHQEKDVKLFNNHANSISIKIKEIQDYSVQIQNDDQCDLNMKI